MGLLRIFNDGRAKKLYKSQKSFELLDLPNLIQGVQTIEFGLLQESPEGGYNADNPWQVVPPGTFGLEIGLYQGTTELSFQNVWVNDDAGGIKTGVLSLNTAAIITAFGAGPTPSELSCTLEIRITDSGGNAESSFQGALTLKRTKMTVGAVASPVLTTATQEWVRQCFVAKESEDGDTIVLRAGSWGVEIKVDQTMGGAVSLKKVDL